MFGFLLDHLADHLGSGCLIGTTHVPFVLGCLFDELLPSTHPHHRPSHRYLFPFVGLCTDHQSACLVFSLLLPDPDLFLLCSSSARFASAGTSGRTDIVVLYCIPLLVLGVQSSVDRLFVFSGVLCFKGRQFFFFFFFFEADAQVVRVGGLSKRL